MLFLKEERQRNRGRALSEGSWGIHPAFLESPRESSPLTLIPPQHVFLSPFITHLKPPHKSGPVGPRLQFSPPKPLPEQARLRQTALDAGLLSTLTQRHPHRAHLLKWHQSLHKLIGIMNLLYFFVFVFALFCFVLSCCCYCCFGRSM